MADSPYLSTAGCEQIGHKGVHSFFAILEPLNVHPESAELAPLVLDRLEQELATRMSFTATSAISASVEAVNEELHHYNQHRPREDRLYYGLTCGISRGDNLYLAQVVPSQILIAQDGELYAFPDLSTWHWSRRSETQTALEQPLGLHGEIEPDLYHTRVEPGDLIVLCSGSLARVIQREPQDVFTRGDADAAIEHLRDLAHAYNVDNATSAAIAVTRASRPSRRRRDFAFLRRVTHLAASLLPEETAERVRGRFLQSESTLDQQAEAVHTAGGWESAVDHETDWPDTIPWNLDVPAARETPAGAWNATEPDAPEAIDHQFWEPHPAEGLTDTETNLTVPSEDDREGKRTLTEILAGAILALSAAFVGVWQLAINRDRSVDGPREEENTYGLPRLQRYDNSIQGPDLSGLRRRLPRAPVSRLTGFISIGLIAAMAIGLFYSITTSRERERVEEFEVLIEDATAARINAAEADDPQAAQSFLQTSDSRLEEAAALGVDDEAIAAEQSAVDDARDTALGIERLGNIQSLGGVPPAPEGIAPRLFYGNGQLYVFTDALYQLDAEESQLIRLIGSGDEVDGEAVGELQSAAWGQGTPIAMDGTNLYVYDSSSASWTRHELGNFGDSYSDVAAISGYIGNFYVLSPPAGQILRYNEGQFDAAPEDWTGGGAAEELSTAVDMVIDGRIYVLTETGQVLDLYRGALDNTIDIQATPEIENAVALSYRPDRDHMYIADEHDRILRVTQDGQFVQQFMSAEDAPEISDIGGIAVDDALGSAYILAGDALLQARLPGPPR